MHKSCKREVVEMLRKRVDEYRNTSIGPVYEAIAWLSDAADTVAAMPVEEAGNYPELYADCLAALATERQRLEKAEEMLREALNMVDGDGRPPNWDALRAFLKDAAKP